MASGFLVSGFGVRFLGSRGLGFYLGIGYGLEVDAFSGSCLSVFMALKSVPVHLCSHMDLVNFFRRLLCTTLWLLLWFLALTSIITCKVVSS